MRCHRLVAIASAVTAGCCLVPAAPASAHAIISLGGVDAVAGRTSRMTLEVQHGCLTDEDGVLQVIAQVGRPWGRLRPQPVSGWSVTRSRLPAGQQIIWTKDDGVPQVFNEPVYFPVDVTWPAKAGVIGMSVTQVCPRDTTTWGTPVAPATGDQESPPQTPLAQVNVLPASRKR